MGNSRAQWEQHFEKGKRTGPRFKVLYPVCHKQSSRQNTACSFKHWRAIFSFLSALNSHLTSSQEAAEIPLTKFLTRGHGCAEL